VRDQQSHKRLQMLQGLIDSYSSDRFKLALKTFLYATYYRIQHIRGYRGDALYKLIIDIDS